MDNKPIERCSTRIAKALSIRNMRQSELCELTKIPKSAVSQYLSGAFEPKQDRLHLIAKALNVAPAWLMGFDVPMEKEERKTLIEPQLTEGEKALLELFRLVPKDKQELCLQMIRVALKTKE